MNKEEFFRELGECLQGEVSEREYRESLSYYREYFDEQEASGKSEDQILDELGSPRLIAHSIIDAHGLENEVTRPKGYYDAGYTDDYQETNEDIVNDPQPGPLDNFLHSTISIITIIGVLVVLGFALHLLFPVILMIVVILVVMSLFRR
jgi:hypothetical protein